MLGARITFYDLGSFGSEWRNELWYSVPSMGCNLSSIKPFGKKLQWFVAPRGFSTIRAADFFRHGDLLAQYRNRKAGVRSILALFYPRQRSAHRLPGRISEALPDDRRPLYGTLEGRVGKTALRFQLDGRNDPIIPTNGTELSSTARGSTPILALPAFPRRNYGSRNFSR